MRHLPTFAVAFAAFATPVLAQPLAVDQPMTTRAIAAAGTLKAVERSPASCSRRPFTGDAPSARLFVAAHVQAGFSQADAVRALLVALGIEAACTNALSNPQLFNGDQSAR